MLVRKLLRQLISSFFFKHLRHSKVIEDLEEEERQRRRALENQKIVRELIIHAAKGQETPLYRLGIKVLSKGGRHIHHATNLFGCPKIFKLESWHGKEDLISHMPKNSPRKIGKNQYDAKQFLCMKNSFHSLHLISNLDRIRTRQETRL